MKLKCCVSDSYKYYFTPSAFHAISKSKSQPNHQQMKRLTKVRRCCFIPGKPSLLERRRGMEQQRKRAQRAALHLLMMARGGRENGAQRRNPNAITQNSLSGI